MVHFGRPRKVEAALLVGIFTATEARQAHTSRGLDSWEHDRAGNAAMVLTQTLRHKGSLASRNPVSLMPLASVLFSATPEIAFTSANGVLYATKAADFCASWLPRHRVRCPTRARQIRLREAAPESDGGDAENELEIDMASLDAMFKKRVDKEGGATVVKLKSDAERAKDLLEESASQTAENARRKAVDIWNGGVPEDEVKDFKVGLDMWRPAVSFAAFFLSLRCLYFAFAGL